MMKDICKVLNADLESVIDDVAKLGSELDKAIKKHDAATEKCKEMAKDVEFWKEKAYEMDKKNCELRSHIWELKKELAEKSKQFDMKIEVTPETFYQIDMLAREIDRLEKENKNCKGMLDTQHEHIKRVEEENVELKNALEAANLRVRKLEGMRFFDEGVKRWMANIVDKTDNKKNPKEFKEILVRECFGRPYYEILYKEDGKMHVGYSSYKLDKVSEWLKEFFID